MTKRVNDNTVKAAELKQELQSFMGDLVRYRHPLNQRLIYSPGVRHLAVKAEAYWLIDAIASWIDSPNFTKASKQDARIEEMHFWRLEVGTDQSAVLFAKADSPCDAFIEQHIEWTDFMLPEIDIWAAFDGCHWTLYLPREH